MRQTPATTRSLQRRILTLTVGGVIVTALLIAFFAAYPFFGQLLEEKQHALGLGAQLRARTAATFLNECESISQSISGRIHARHQLQRYVSGAIDLAVLRSENEAILEEVMQQYPQVVSLQRFTTDGKPIVRLGELLGERPRPGTAAPQGSLGHTLDGALVWIRETEILNHLGLRLGVDRIAFALTPIAQTLQDQSYLHADSEPAFLIDVAGDTQLLTAKPDDPGVQLRPLEAVGDRFGVLLGESRPAADVYTQSGYLTAQAPLEGSGWRAVISMPTNAVYAPVLKLAVWITLAVALILTLAVLVVVRLIRPLTGKTITESDQLSAEVASKTTALETSEHRLREAQRIAKLGHWTLHGEDTLELSAQAADTLGLPDNTQFCPLQDFLNLLPTPDRDRVRHALRTLGQGTKGLCFDICLHRADGSKRSVEFQAEVSGEERVGTILDISERKLIEEELTRHRDHLEELVADRTQELEAFSYSVSHDLRAPLRSIEGFSGVLEEEYPDCLGDAGREYLGRIRRARGRMSDLIDALLALSQISRAEMQYTSVELSEMADSILQEMSDADPVRDHEFLVDRKLHAHADPQLMRVLLQNLLGNAWKYTTGKPCSRIEMGICETERGPAFRIRDNGVGFDMAYADRIFTPFQRLHRDDEFQGSGIGLATVQRIIGRHKGHVWVESAPDQGTSVYFTLGEQYRAASSIAQQA